MVKLGMMYYCFANTRTFSCWKTQGDRQIKLPVNWSKILNNCFWAKKRIVENQRLETVKLSRKHTILTIRLNKQKLEFNRNKRIYKKQPNIGATKHRKSTFIMYCN